MTNVKNQKRMAADVLKCGESKVWIDPENLDEVSNAITKADVRRLVQKGFIAKKKTNNQSRGRSRVLREKKLKGRRKGPGRRKGSKHAGSSKKRDWISTIRPLRKRLKELRDSGMLKKGAYRKLYRMAKAGAFRSKNHLNLYIEDHDLKTTN